MTYNVTPICYCSFEGEFDRMTAFYKKVEIVSNFLRKIKQEKICFIKLENNGNNNLVLVRDLLGRYEVRNLSDKIMKNELTPKDFKKVSKKEFKKIIIKLEEKHILKNLQDAKWNYEKWEKHFNYFKNKKGNYSNL